MDVPNRWISDGQAGHTIAALTFLVTHTGLQSWQQSIRVASENATIGVYAIYALPKAMLLRGFVSSTSVGAPTRDRNPVGPTCTTATESTSWDLSCARAQ